MYNTTAYQGLVEAQAGDSWATLERLDGLGSYQFLVNPEEENWSFSAEFAKLPVAATSQPIVNYKSSDSTLSLPKVYIWTPDNSKQVRSVLDTLITFTRPIKNGDNPPLIKLSYGDTLVDRCYLAKLQVTAKMKLGGNVTMAECSMDFLIAPELPKVELAPLEEKAVIKLTEKELQEASKLVLDAFTADPKLCEKFKVKPNALFGVTDDLKVTADGKPIGTLEEILGANTPAKWTTPKMA